MSFRWVVLIVFLLLFSGCAAIEGPRWALLGDSSQEAFYIDRQSVERLPSGDYQFPIKVCHYLDGQPHTLDESHDTNQVLYVELSCRQRHWTEISSGVIDQNGKTLFMRRKLVPTAKPIAAGTIQRSAYSYICNDENIVAEHSHE